MKRDFSDKTKHSLTVLARLLVVILFMFSIFSITKAQVPMKAKDNKSAIDVSEFEKINLSDGQFSFNLPLASVGGRGTGSGIALNIQPSWRIDEVIIGYSGASPNVDTRLGRDPYVPDGLFPQNGGYLVINTRVVDTVEWPYCSNETNYYASAKAISINFSGFGGDSLSFVSEQSDGGLVTFPRTLCYGEVSQSIGNIFVATDGSGSKFIADGQIFLTDDLMSANGYGNPNLYPSGVIKLPNGTTYRVDNGVVSWIEDRNGNRTTLTWAGAPEAQDNQIVSIKDSLNRETWITSDGTFQYVNYRGTGGAVRSFKISPKTGGTSNGTLSSIFNWIPGNSHLNYPTTCGKQNYVELPNQKRYTFTYDCAGFLSRVELPTGGKIEYDHEIVSAARSLVLTRRIVERRVYSDGVNLDSRTTYQYSDQTNQQPGTTIPSEYLTTVSHYEGQNTLKSVEKHYFYGCIPDGYYCGIPGSVYQPEPAQKLLKGREYKSEIYGSDGTTLLRKSESTFEPRRRLTWTSNPWNTNPYYVDYRVTDVTNTLADSNQVSKSIYQYDPSVNYNLRIEQYDYDYGVGQPSNNCVRRTHWDYEKGAVYTSNAVRLLNLPTYTFVSDCNATPNVISNAVYEYDNYSAGSNHEPLIDRPNITGHNSSFGTSYTTRGNLTKTTSYAGAMTWTGAVSTYMQYDIAGNVVKTFDANGNATTIDYSDRFGSASTVNIEARSNSAPAPLNGQSTFAFASSATNVKGWKTYVQRDYYTGGVVDAEDINENISTTFYNDILDRPTQTISNNNRAELRSQATVIYDDNGRKVTVTADSKTFGDNLIKTEAFYDGLGRTFESRDYETTSNYIVSKTEFDKLGRAYKSANPYRPYLSETAQWTTTGFDDLGRVTTVTTPDNAVVSRSYSGSTTTVTDQAGRKRRGTTDAIGRLLNVVEDPNGLNYVSTYTYDVLGRLRKTTQTEGSTTQNRYFMYDDLGRLIRAKQVEQNSNSNLNLSDPITGNSSWSVKYTYDNNGNITFTTDALNRTITGTYDNLNRLTLRDYSDTTPDVTFTYDDPNIANSKGKLTAVSSIVSATNYTAFDILGRIKSSTQTTGGQTYNFSDYTYDLSDGLVSQAYPSGRVVTTETDDLGRLSRVASQLPNQVQKTMISQLDYTSFGAVKQARLGNGKWESAQFDNKRLQVTQIGLGGSAGDTSLLKLELGYGTTSNNGALLQQKITIPGTTQIIQNYAYDNFNRLNSATETVNNSQTWKQTFSYDRFGNRSFDANNTTTFGSCSAAVCNPDVDLAKNQFTVAQGYNYDSEGNLTSNSENQLIAYDAENRIKQIQNTATQATANYDYDGNGKRVRKIIGNQETYFVYDAFGKLVAEYTTNQAIPQNGTQYLTTDSLGSPRIATSAIGQVASRHDYMPYGEEVMAGVGGRTTTHGYGQIDNARQKFTGYERDDESGLDFAQNRYFSSKHGRFTSVDPLSASANIKAPQTLNRYNYGNNSPYKFTDPTGLISESEYDGTQDKIDDGFNRELGIETARQEADFDRRVQNTLDAAAANRAFAKGDDEAGWNIIRGNNALEARDANGNVVPDPNEPTVTVEASITGLASGGALTQVIIWNSTLNKDELASTFGHVSYIRNGHSYSWGGEWDYRWKSRQYTEERRMISAGVGYILDFGTKELNQRFWDALHDAYTGTQGYKLVTNNCGHAFQRAINSIAKDLGIRKNNYATPGGHRKYIKNVLQPAGFVKGTVTYPKNSGEGAKAGAQLGGKVNL